MDNSNFLIDCLFKFEGVEGFKDCFEFVFDLFGNVIGFKDSLIRSLGLVVMFDGFGSEALFGQEFDRRDEEIVVEAPLGFVEVIEQGHDFRVFESSVAEPLTDVSVVFAFNVSVVIFLIFPGAGELDRGFTAEEIIHEEFVEEFLAVITVEAEDGKG